jgi:hypothetical protein
LFIFSLQHHVSLFSGLPYNHISYVQNIVPGMPLFLFNYSDRKLHGIFEATSEGELHIDPSAWSRDGKSETGYPAQVREKEKKKSLVTGTHVYMMVLGLVAP